MQVVLVGSGRCSAGGRIRIR